MARHVDCLNLVGDGDDVDLALDVEKAFAVKLTDAEARRCETVGRLYDIVASKLNISDARGLRCPTALAFFRLRAGLRRIGYQHRVTSKTKLRSLFRGREGKAVRRRLETETGLALRFPMLDSMGLGVLSFVLVAGLVAALGLGSWMPLLAGIGATIIIARLLPQPLPAETKDLGQLAVACAVWNYGQLSAACGGARSSDLWKALVEILVQHCGTEFRSEIDRGTRFFRH